MEEFVQIGNKIKESNKVAIFSHKSPDGDCIGSGLAVYYMLKKFNKEVDVYCEDVVHDNYKFLAGDIFKTELEHNNYDLLISVDCSDLTRITKFADYFSNHNNTINIDHHATNVNFAKINCVKSGLSSACELIYDIFTANDYEIDKDIAMALYSGIATDTGCFMYNSVNEKTHNVAGKLLNYDLDIDYIHYNLFRKKTYEEVMLLEESLKNLQLFANRKIAITYLPLKTFKKYGVTNNAYVGVVNMITNIIETEVGVSMVEDVDNAYKISFRTKGNVDVSQIALRFGGGGHKMAAGCKIYGKAHSVIKKIIKVIEEFL